MRARTRVRIFARYATCREGQGHYLYIYDALVCNLYGCYIRRPADHDQISSHVGLSYVHHNPPPQTPNNSYYSDKDLVFFQNFLDSILNGTKAQGTELGCCDGNDFEQAWAGAAMTFMYGVLTIIINLLSTASTSSFFFGLALLSLL